ncbi:MAG: hypothetical protein P8R42_01045 [Candidatus Binatia bacterium]|nr:hypothetical protein [Candidatus Binatia bacterium]
MEKGHEVRFTDALTDISGRAALGNEMARNQDLFGGYEVLLADQVYRYATPSGVTYVRHTVNLLFSNGSQSIFTNYVRIRDGRIERLAGFLGRRLAEMQ